MRKKVSFIGILSIMIASSLTIMVESTITPALPEIGDHFNMENSSSWLVTLPALGVVLWAVFIGKIVDNKGPYYVMMIGLLFYGLLGTMVF